MVTLAALCGRNDLDLYLDVKVELSRINRSEVVEKIRNKQASKPSMSPLPGPSKKISRRDISFGLRRIY